VSSTSGERPALVITGASGFLGRHLVAALRDRTRIFGLARRPPASVGLPPHPNVTWFQVDIGDRESLGRVFAELRAVPGPKLVLHLAAHYDFTGELHPEYEHTNLRGLRNVLEECRALRPVRFLFASSVAACRFPAPGTALDERSPTDGDHIYARTKNWGERQLARYAADFPSAVVRLGALFSDWCEYPPLFHFLQTWLSRRWNRRMLGGRGRSAIPYLHVRCAVDFFSRLLEVHQTLAPGEVLIASSDGCVSHRETFEAATLAFHGRRGVPILVPRPVARLGLRALLMAGNVTGVLPFERPWMGRFIDLQLAVDASRTRARLGWSPNPRLAILRRLPFLVDKLRHDPVEWQRRNLAAMKPAQLEPNFRVVSLLERHEPELLRASMAELGAPEGAARFPSYRALGEEEIRWAKRQLFLQLRTAVRTRDVGVFRAYCRQLADRRRAQGFPVDEVVGIIAAEHVLCLRLLRSDPAALRLGDAIEDHVSRAFVVGMDEIQDAYDAVPVDLPQDLG
jgi:nucleoside-diphosphate-sugar epimerase